MKSMKCPMCAGEMKSRRESRRYTECGLDNITLQNLEVRHCAQCGEELEVIPQIEELHRLLAYFVAKKRPRLLPNEVRFLRTYLGFSSVDFAKKIGVTKETVSRWERADEPLAMRAPIEKFLRTLALYANPIAQYEPEMLDDMAKDPAKVERVRLKLKAGNWKSAA